MSFAVAAGAAFGSEMTNILTVGGSDSAAATAVGVRFQWMPAAIPTLRKTLDKLKCIRARMALSPGERTQDYIREARDGGVHGFGSDR